MLFLGASTETTTFLTFTDPPISSQGVVLPSLFTTHNLLGNNDDCHDVMMVKTAMTGKKRSI